MKVDKPPKGETNSLVQTLLTCPIDGCIGCLNVLLPSDGEGFVYCNECASAIAAAHLIQVTKETAKEIDDLLRAHNF